ncbi:MAG TPA: M28 family peptidase [Candidatus Cloacimonetes bacterium]|nr:M28 family peptidase [Candidatus Cloacimonadota bacterium]
MNKIWLLLISIFLLLSCQNQVPEFDKDNAFRFLTEQCDLGFRYPGTEEIKLCRKYIISNLEPYASSITEQKLSAEIDTISYDGINIIAGFYPEMSRRILLGAHYDTREWADKDSIQENHQKHVLGANDGASGVAVLLEIARIISQNQPSQFGIDLVFFDLEDAGTYGNMDTWCVGSAYFVNNFSGQKPEKVIIIDMVGDADLNIFMEIYSYRSSPNLVKEVWSLARKLEYPEFIPKIKYMIEDDHLPFIKAGFNAIDIIDFDYPYWHTIHDTPDKCSSESLYKVGQLLLHLIYKEQ